MSSQIVEETRVPAAFDPFVQPAGERAGQQVRDGEQAPLARIEHVEVLDRFVQFAVLEIAQAVCVVAFEQHAHERMEEMQVLRRRLQGKRVDGDVGLSESDFQIATAQQGGQLPVAVAQIEDDRERVVLLCVRHEEVGKEALPAAGGAQDQRVADVLDVQVERVRVVMRRLEDGERLAAQMRTDASLLRRA